VVKESKISSEQKVLLGRYQQLVESYASVLDLASPKLLAEFQTGIARSYPFAEEIHSGDCVLDIGSGAGLPGIPMAILCPNAQITLCEIRSKRAAFLERAVSSLGLKNVTVYNGDVQKIRGEFNVVAALWSGSFERLYSLSKNVVTEQWKLISRKGDEFETELEALKTVAKVVMFHVKQLDDGAKLVVVQGET
jgi:16S rRNA (guanine527-N7)-methyltransferase